MIYFLNVPESHLKPYLKNRIFWEYKMDVGLTGKRQNARG